MSKPDEGLGNPALVAAAIASRKESENRAPPDPTLRKVRNAVVIGVAGLTGDFVLWKVGQWIYDQTIRKHHYSKSDDPDDPRNFQQVARRLAAEHG